MVPSKRSKSVTDGSLSVTGTFPKISGTLITAGTAQPRGLDIPRLGCEVKVATVTRRCKERKGCRRDSSRKNIERLNLTNKNHALGLRVKLRVPMGR
jgi:hypothetical protein